MSWASERCKPQHISASLCFFAQRSAWRCLAFSLSATQNFTIVRRSRSNRHLNSFRRRMSREGEIPAWSSAPSCSAESRTAPHNLASLPHRSKFTIKTCPPSAALRGEAGVTRHCAHRLVAPPCLAKPSIAPHHLPIVPDSRSKSGPITSSPTW